MSSQYVDPHLACFILSGASLWDQRSTHMLWCFGTSGLSEFLDLSSERLHWAAPPGTDAGGVSAGAALNGTDQHEGTAAGEPGATDRAAPPAAAAGLGASSADAPKEPPPDEVFTTSCQHHSCSIWLKCSCVRV